MFLHSIPTDSKLRVLFLVLFSELIVFIKAEQNYQSYNYNQNFNMSPFENYHQYPIPEYNSQYNGQYGPALPDHNLRTFWYKNRRYGQSSNYVGWRPGDPRIGEDERYIYDRNGNQKLMLPGVLEGWREDLQGKRRDQTRDQRKDIFVKTTHGEVQGFIVDLFDNPDPESNYRPGAEFIDRKFGQTSVFLGIPYAEPPINKARFKPPRWHKGWELLQAVDFGPACPQPTRFTTGIRDIDEDCLYLNIYVPQLQEGVGQKYPVMFYIHGGHFIHGASNNFPGHIMATFYKVVVVTINYRLGALGFLSTGDINSPGNYGILDQAMALRWTYENIESFNGDRSKITLFGPGAGAASAGLLMVFSETKHMISGVIAQSGSPLADWSMIFDKYRAQNTSRVFGKIIGCGIESSWQLVNCLTNSRNFNEIGNAEFPPDVGLFPWAPVIEMNFTAPYYEGWNEKDWHLLYESPENLIRKWQYNRGIRYMSGVTMQEAAHFLTSNRSLEPDFIIKQEFFDQKVKELVLRYNYTLNPNGTYDAIKYMYTYWPDPHNSTFIREKYIELLTDFLYVAPNDKMIKLLVENNVPVYMYVLNTTIESFHYPEWTKVPHDIEHYLLCGAPFMDVEFFPMKNFTRGQWTNNDRNMSHFFMAAFTNFAKYGNPTYTQILGIHFEVAEHGMLKYLNLNTTYNSSIRWNYRQTESAFWTHYIPTLVGHLVPTYPPTTEFWWEPAAPLQIAFWGVSATCLLLVVFLVVCCLLWQNAKRQVDRNYSNMYMVYENGQDSGIENTGGLEYDYREKLHTPTSSLRKNSTSPLSTDMTLGDVQSVMSDITEAYRDGASVKLKSAKSNFSHTVPQTDV